LEEAVSKSKLTGNVGIGHVRWATHGIPNTINAHPHSSENVSVVHNGIIENSTLLKKYLIKKGHKFKSQTDTEVIVHLFEFYFNKNNDAKLAFDNTIARLRGTYSILLITKSAPNTIFFVKHGSPLIVAKGHNQNEIFFSSSDAPLIGLSDDVVYLEDGVSGIVTNEKLIFDSEVQWKKLPISKQFAKKNGFRFFTEKEIYEQSDVATDCMIG
jgi:glucosamine--fructose-6-phosphate aminotransferase (isomerizing)